MTETMHNRTTLVLGGTGKVGRRLVERLTRRNVPVRIGSRSAGLPFDWEQPSSWHPVFQDVEAVYTYVPDLVLADPCDAIARLVETALDAGVQRMVLMSGRGEDYAQACEKIVIDSGVDWTVLRSSFFNQNFCQGFLLDSVLNGEVMLPAGDVGEPFIDTDDIAEVAATVLTEDGHGGQIYDLTGPRLLSFAEATAAIAKATGRDIAYTRISGEDFAAGLAADGVPPEIVDAVVDLFATVLDGRNSVIGDGVTRVLARPARDFDDYVQAATASGVWTSTHVGSSR